MIPRLPISWEFESLLIRLLPSMMMPGNASSDEADRGDWVLLYSVPLKRYMSCQVTTAQGRGSYSAQRDRPLNPSRPALRGPSIS